MNKNIVKILFIMTAVVILSFLPAMAQDGVVTASVPEDFRALKMDGSTFRLSDLRGKVVLLNIFATWCEPCEQELPQLNNLQIHIEANNLNIAIIGAAIDTNQRDVQNYVVSRLMKYDIIFYNANEMRNFPAQHVPTKYILDRNGVVVDIIVGGPWTDQQLLRRITPFL